MTVLDPILCHRLKDEIDISIATAQAFLDYKRGDMTFDRFVMDAMEIASASPLYIEKYHREFIEAQRSLTAICDYEGLFNAVVHKVEDTLSDEELDDLWEFGKDYSTSMFQKLVY